MSTTMNGVEMDLVSEEMLSSLTSMEKIRYILDNVRQGKILVLERGLTPEEQSKLIEMTMSEINLDDFIGIEIESYPAKEESSLLRRLLKKPSLQTRLTMIGPARHLKTLKKDREVISALVSMR
ncbi:MAG: uncharacterized protein PWR26_777 [Methanosarcinales archaeon]|nr:MAG: hypothetical protein XD46_1239 [Euryarchaeota archaeon 55_53]KUK29721.1 MAG: hypothetical protein XD62_1221 [Methanosarcinales archeaon 56_1174]MDI3488060.1 uncharacterized protein [Methanosarcinales archaeon]MDN5295681.1 uncharacterized protein [Methanosarcinales archaeon]